jgi:outer membrane protein TolC
MNRERSAIALACATLLLALPARAEVVALETLEQSALNNRALVDIERARTSGAYARAELARASTHPTLSFNAQGALAPGNVLVRVNDINGNEYFVSGSRSIGTSGAFLPHSRYAAGLTLESKIYDFGRSADAIRAADAGSRAAEADRDAARARILREVRSAYLDWLVARGTAEIAAESAANARERHSAIEARVQEGTRPPTDLLPLRSDEARTRLALVQATGRLNAARLGVEAATASALSSSAEPDAALFDLSPPATSTPLSAALTALERRRDAALATARSHEHRFLPVITGAAEAGLRGQGTELFPAYRIGVSLSLALLDGETEAAQRSIARAQVAELSAQANDLSQSLSIERRAGESAFASAVERVRAALELQTAAKAEYDAAAGRYELGAANIDAVIEARSLLVNARLELLQARAARADAVLRLRALHDNPGVPSR